MAQDEKHTEEEWERNLEEKIRTLVIDSGEQKVSVSTTTSTVSRSFKGRGRSCYENSENETAEFLVEDSCNSKSFKESSAASISGHSKLIEDLGTTDHILELYGFPSSFTTKDLEIFLEPYKCFGLKLKWVDIDHALALFCSPAFG